MPEYRRYYQPGGSFFFTVVTENRAPVFESEVARRQLNQAFTETTRRWPFRVSAIVLLPDHLHAIWTLPKHDTDYSRRWAFLKKQFTKAWLDSGGSERPISALRVRNRRCGVWQRRYWEHLIRDEGDFERHCDYIHYNPVKHGLTTCPHGWPYSSFVRFVDEGFYPKDWCCACGRRRDPAPEFDDLVGSVGE